MGVVDLQEIQEVAGVGVGGHRDGVEDQPANLPVSSVHRFTIEIGLRETSSLNICISALLKHSTN